VRSASQIAALKISILMPGFLDEDSWLTPGSSHLNEVQLLEVVC